MKTKMHHKFYQYLFIFVCCNILQFNCFAQEDINTPDGLIRSVVTEVMTKVQADHDMQSGNFRKIQQMVYEIILPHADFKTTAEMAMGINWKKASDSQRQSIINEFALLLIHTYSGAISQIRDQKIQFGRVRIDNDKALMPTTVLQNGEKLQLYYRLKKIDSAWKVYDMNVLGVWLIEVYKTQFKEKIAKQGIDGLIVFLQKRNLELKQK